MKCFEKLKTLLSKDEKIQKPEPRKIEISWPEKIEILELLDAIATKKGRKEGYSVDNDRVWSLVGNLVPETEEGNWRLSPAGSHLFVIEEI